MNIVSIIIAITVLISFQANKNPDLKQRFLYIPFQLKHNNEYYRLISHIFIHADISHLAFNMISLYFLGSTLSYYFIDYYGLQLGTTYLLILYFAGAIFASLPSFFKHQDNSSYRSLGASGAVSAVIFAAILWDPSMSLGILFIPFPIPAYIFGPIYLAVEYFSMKRGGTGIAHDAHIGGAVFGILFVLLLNINKGKEFLDLFF
ncbi:MAG: rhomboid family intramembrane serine protease [Flavobacteriia bacterium]|nr:rhomboid family intramembrane serine protease [Flavobacteriia bacterium]